MYKQSRTARRLHWHLSITFLVHDRVAMLGFGVDLRLAVNRAVMIGISATVDFFATNSMIAAGLSPFLDQQVMAEQQLLI